MEASGPSWGDWVLFTGGRFSTCSRWAQDVVHKNRSARKSAVLRFIMKVSFCLMTRFRPSPKGEGLGEI